MTTCKPITQAEIQSISDWLSKQGLSASDAKVGRGLIAKQFGIPEGRARRILDRIRAESPDSGVDTRPSETREYVGNKLIVNIDGIPFNDPDLLMEHLKLDSSIWRLDRFKFKAYQGFAAQKAQSQVMARPDKKGGGNYVAWVRPEKTSIIKADLYSVTASYERKVELIAAREEVDAFIARAKCHAPKYKPFVRKPKSGNMLELDIFDAHLGKLAWGRETGYSDYDLKIGGYRFEEATEVIVDRTKHFGFDQIVLPIGNDLLQADTKAGTTTAGTHVDTDGRFERTFETAHKLLVGQIDRLSSIADVKVVVVPGNHDELAAWTLGFALQCWYRSNANVTIDNSPKVRKYHEFGKCMQMYTHGNKGKHKEYGLVMATEQPDMFGRTRYREAHVGHLHQDRVSSMYGVVVRILRALCSADSWHAGNAYVGNQEGAEGFVFNREQGLIATAFYTVPEGKAAA
jgi:hypothetical protein